VTTSVQGMDIAVTPQDSQRLGSLRPIANLCTSGACPTIYLSDSGAMIVQGFSVSAEEAGIDVPDGERLVEIPRELLAEALRSVS
jgi:hypothetical protein